MKNSISPLSASILIKLNQASQAGYDITKAMMNSFVWKAAHQQVYRELVKLLNAGLLSVELVPSDIRPDKKLYSLTDVGRTALAELGEFIEPKLDKVQSMHTIMVAAKDIEYFYNFAAILDERISSLQLSLQDAMATEGYPFDELMALKRELRIQQSEMEFCLEVIDNLKDHHAA